MFTKNNYRNVGQTELRVSPITLGTMTFGDQNTQSDAFEQLLGIGLKVKKERTLLSQRRLQALGDLLIG